MSTDRTAIWWKRRKPDEPTNEYLSRVLKSAGLNDMAERALAYHFDDYLAPDEVDNGDNIRRLYNELHREIAKHAGSERAHIAAIASAVVAGEFDGTKQEADAWARSAEGQEALEAFRGLFH